MEEQQGFSQEQHAPTGKLEPRLFGNYELVHRIDVGGMGEVYLAHQKTAFGREVAVKIIRSDLVYDVIARKRFQREAEVSAYLKHDHILPLLEFGEEQGRLFLVTPYIRGGTLAKRLHRGPLPLGEVHQLFTALVEAVAYLHRRGVIHRDLKPSNILLDRAEDDNRVYVRLIDFGIASLQGAQASAPLTKAGHEMGTEAYMAPERVDGVVAPSNDIYSLGLICCQMLTGKLPNDAPSVPLPEPFAYVIRRCTAPNPANRFASAEELLQVFKQAYLAVKQSSPHLNELSPIQPIPSNPTPSPAPAHESGPPQPVRPAQNGVDRPLRELSPRLKEQTGQGFRAPSRLSSTGSQPAIQRQASGPQPAIQRQVSGPQPAVQRSLANSQPVPSRPEIILPPLPGKDESFAGNDYDAPTSYIDPKVLTRQSKSSSSTGLQPRRKKGNKRTPKMPVFLPIFLVMGVVILIIVGVFLTYVQAATTATITIMPRTQVVSEVFTLTAKVNAPVDAASSTIPANVFSSTKTSSLEGQTTGSAGCVLGIFDCKQAVSANDVFTLSNQATPGLKEQIKQDLQKQAQAAGALTIGDIIYGNSSVTSDPAVGTVSKTVKVTLTMTGSQEYIKPQDARSVATQLLKQKVKKKYELVDSLVQIGSPVVQKVDKDGTVKLAVAAGGVARYQISQDVQTAIQKRIKGLKVTEARTLLTKERELDPAGLSVHVSLGDTIPNDLNQIKIKVLNPTMPRIQLTPVATP